MRLNWFTLLISVFLISFYSFLLLVPINLATADLGRHIRNGEQLLSGNFDLLYRNYYSYTNPDFPFINHHWFGGVVFYLVAMFSGLIGVQLLFIFINLTTFCLFFSVGKKYSNIYVSSILALLIIPIIAYRDEVRPEAFSYLFAAIYYLVLKGFSEGRVNKRWFFGLIPIQLIWANTHIYFFVGFFILGVYWLEGLLDWIRRKHEGANNFQSLTLIGLAMAAVSLLNPHLINGLIYPFTIFGNYGYRVLENQSVFFLEGVISVPVLVYFKITLGILVLSWIYALYRLFKFKDRIDLPNLIFSLAFSFLALIQIRNLALFGFFSLAIIASNLKVLKLEANKYLLLPTLAIVLIFVLVINPAYFENRPLGLGLASGIERGAEFFAQEKIKGPIFNNYDIGGYLIYYFASAKRTINDSQSVALFPKEKVFVDNRPEGYPADFFTKVYVPMQENDDIWKQKLAEYNFNSIFFYRQDLTPWAQRFLIARIKDPDWAPVFVDNYNIIFVKRIDQNADLIKKYELPKEMFKME